MKKNRFLIIIFICLSIIGTSNRLNFNYNLNDYKKNQFENFNNTDTNLLLIYVVNKYSDSLNSWKIGDTLLPKFIFDSKFDINCSQYWKSTVFTCSVRKLILDKVDNKVLLVHLIDKYSKELSIISKSNFFKIPFEDFSWYQLILYRYDELTNQKNLKPNDANELINEKGGEKKKRNCKKRHK